MKKIVAFMASPRKNGNTAALVNEVARGARDSGAEVKIYNLNELQIRPCQACMLCRREYACSQKDGMQSVYADLKDAAAVVLGSPVYMWDICAQAKLLLDRLFPLLGPDFKPRTGRKHALLVFAQGNPDGDAFSGNRPDSVSACFKDTAKLLGFFGMESVRAPLVQTNGNSGCAAAENKELMGAAYAAGKALAS